jgi:hypothetical protein
MTPINFGDLSSWILVFLIGLGLEYATNNGILTQYSNLGELLMFAGLALGTFYFYTDVSNKV